MIQRPQSIYLLLAAALLALFLIIGGDWNLVAAAVLPWSGTLALVLAGLTIAASLGAIFLYKDRPRQRQVVMGAQWLDLALVVLVVGVMIVASLEDVILLDGDVIRGAYFDVIMPFLAYIFLRFARRGVEKDIELVRSMDRLR